MKLGKYWSLLAPTKDYGKSFGYLSRAAALGLEEPRDHHIKNLLGAHYFFGWGVDVDQERASRLTYLAVFMHPDQNAASINDELDRLRMTF